MLRECSFVRECLCDEVVVINNNNKDNRACRTTLFPLAKE